MLNRIVYEFSVRLLEKGRSRRARSGAEGGIGAESERGFADPRGPCDSAGKVERVEAFCQATFGSRLQSCLNPPPHLRPFSADPSSPGIQRKGSLRFTAALTFVCLYLDILKLDPSSDVSILHVHDFIFLRR